MSAKPQAANNKYQLTDPEGWFDALRPGEFPNVSEGVHVMQVVTAATLAALLADWKANGRPELLVDRDHFSDDPGKATEALGWVSDLRLSGDRLQPRARWTEQGERALTGGNYRYCSLVLQTREIPGQAEDAGKTAAKPMLVEPVSILRVALTNRPNISQLRPISNRAPGTPEPTNQPNTQPAKKTMDLIPLAKELALPETATLEEILAAVKALKTTASAANTAAAEATLEQYKNRIPAGQEDYFRTQLVSNRAPTETLLKAMPEIGGAEPEKQHRVHNRGQASAPGTPGSANKPADSDLHTKQTVHLRELRNRCPAAPHAELVLQAAAERPEIWPEM